MKYLILIVVLLAVLWIWRARGAGPHAAGRKNDKRPQAQPQDMVECPVCRVHLPRGDALAGPDGQLYCCAEHRARPG